MEATAVLSEVAALVNECQTLRAENERLKQSSINADRFYSAMLSTEEVGRLHGVSKDTVLNYVKRGLIEKAPDSTDGKVRIRASVALMLDFGKMKDKLKYMLLHNGCCRPDSGTVRTLAAPRDCGTGIPYRFFLRGYRKDGEGG